MQSDPFSVVMLGATGAVGQETLKALMAIPTVGRISLLGRRPVPDLDDSRIHQHTIDIFTPATYAEFLTRHQIAICTLGVGEPSKMSKADFVKIDKDAVLDFARACKAAGISHFQLLGSVDSNARSASFYLRTKGELVEELEALHFERLSIFEPSMILTPTNRYGFLQGLTLSVWPLLSLILVGSLRKYRGIRINQLGRAIAFNPLQRANGVEKLQWADFRALHNLN